MFKKNQHFNFLAQKSSFGFTMQQLHFENVEKKVYFCMN